jgi:hypothetical protein
MLGLPLSPPCEVRLVGDLRVGLFPLKLLAAAAKAFQSRAALCERRGQLVADARLVSK